MKFDGAVRDVSDVQFNAGNAVKFLADKIAAFDDPARRSALTVQLLGARQSQWTGFLEKGAAGISDLTSKTSTFTDGAASRVSVLAAMNASSVQLAGVSNRLKEFLHRPVRPTANRFGRQIRLVNHFELGRNYRGDEALSGCDQSSAFVTVPELVAKSRYNNQRHRQNLELLEGDCFGRWHCGQAHVVGIQRGCIGPR